MAAFLTDDERRRIAAAIRQVEAQTSAELVAVVAREADSYGYIPTLWAALVALVLPTLALALDVHPPPLWMALCQLASFVVLALLGQIAPIRHALLPPSVKRSRAARLAREQFLVQGVTRTAERSGVLIFVAVAERHVEILADIGIAARVDESVWRDAVAGFVVHVAAGRTTDGFLSAIERCGRVLIAHFPAPARNPDELPDRLVEL